MKFSLRNSKDLRLSWMIVSYQNSVQINYAVWKHELQWGKIIPLDTAIEWKQSTEGLVFVKDVRIL